MFSFSMYYIWNICEPHIQQNLEKEHLARCLDKYNNLCSSNQVLQKRSNLETWKVDSRQADKSTRKTFGPSVSV